MAIRWDLLSTGNPAAALQAGMEHGQEQRRKADTRGALSALAANPDDTAALGVLRGAAPELSFKVEDKMREQRSRAILSRVFAPAGGAGSPARLMPSAPSGDMYGYGKGPVNGAGGALSLAGYGGNSTPVSPLGQFAAGQGGPVSVAPGASTTPSPMAASLPAPAGATAAQSILPPSMQSTAMQDTGPATLVDPAQLPPRTDGMQVNQAALRELYVEDPKTAFEVQKMIYAADKSQMEAVMRSGQTLASAAFNLEGINLPDGSEDIAGRKAAVARMAPLLTQVGVSQQTLDTLDVSNRSLAGIRSIYSKVGDLMTQNRNDQRLANDIADDEADNYRADRNVDDVIADRAGRRGLVARGQNMADARGRYGIGVASSDRRRGQDLSSTDRRRGQDMTDTRIRETGGSKGGARVRPGNRPPQIPGTAANPAVVTSREQAMLLPKGTVFRTPDGAVKVR